MEGFRCASLGFGSILLILGLLPPQKRFPGASNLLHSLFTRCPAYWEKTRTRYRKSRQERYVWKVSDAIGWFLERFFHFDRPFERSFEVHEPRNAMKLNLSATKFKESF